MLFAGPNDSTKTTSKIFQFDSANFPVQVSVLPGMGTNGRESGKFTNNVSLNIIAGYNGGVEGLEVGGFSNTIKTDVTGIQVAGFSNQVMGEVNGLQWAGFSNFSKAGGNSLQFSGFVNTNLGNTNGIQGAGFSNVVNGDFNGIQGSGFSNVVIGDAIGIQGSGFSNVVTGDLQGIQASGFSNVVTDSLTGIQASGFANVSKSYIKGLQVAGFLNASKEIDGYQLSGFTNVTGKLNGLQLGFINFADSVEQGAPIGFLSFVRKGFHKIEISSSESFTANLTLKTGVEGFYNILTAGANFTTPTLTWGLGYGIGSMTRINEKWSFNSDLIVNYVGYENEKFDDLNMLVNWQIEASYMVAKHLTIFGGASINGFYTTKYDYDKNDFDTRAVPYSVFEFDDGWVKQLYYPGVNVGVRF
jgi:hypothetical protein